MEEAAAEGTFVHVYVDNTGGPGDRPVVPLPAAIRAAVEPLLQGWPQGNVAFYPAGSTGPAMACSLRKPPMTLPG